MLYDDSLRDRLDLFRRVYGLLPAEGKESRCATDGPPLEKQLSAAAEVMK